jgi:hypothetical protein
MKNGYTVAVIGVVLAAASLVVAVLQLNAPTRVLAPSERPELVAQVFNVKMFGATRQFVESISGPAIKTENGVSEYVVGGCTIEVGYDENGAVQGVSMLLSEVCTFDWGANTSEFASSPPHELRFGDVMKEEGYYLWVDATNGAYGNAREYGDFAKVHVDDRTPRNPRQGRFITFEAKGWSAASDSIAKGNLELFSKIDQLAKAKAGELGVAFERCNGSIGDAELEVIAKLRVTKIYLGDLGWGDAEECLEEERPEPTNVVPAPAPPAIGPDGLPVSSEKADEGASASPATQ